MYLRAAKVMLAFGLSALVAILIPFVGWVYGWPGTAICAALSVAFTYVFGLRIARRSRFANAWAWPLVFATAPCLIGTWALLKDVTDPAGWAEWLIGCVMAVAVLAAMGLQE